MRTDKDNGSEAMAWIGGDGGPAPRQANAMNAGTTKHAARGIVFTVGALVTTPCLIRVFLGGKWPFEKFRQDFFLMSFFGGLAVPIVTMTLDAAA